jgi:membrane protein implicated in regulation of membrane protease activity
VAGRAQRQGKGDKVGHAPPGAAERAPRGREQPPSPADRPLLFAGVGAAFIGALLLAGLAIFSVRDAARRRELLPAQGTVLEQRNQSYGAESRVVVTVRFQTASGQLVHFDQRYAAGDTTRPAKGDTVRVLYEPGNPGKAEIDGGGVVGQALVGAVGVGFLLMGLAVLGRVFAERRRRRALAKG